MSRTYPVPAVIVGFEENGLGIARALARRKIPVLAIGGPRPSAVEWTRTAQVHRARSWTKEGVLEALREVAARLEFSAPLLISRDDAVEWVGESRSELEPAFRIALPDPGTIAQLMNKRQILELASKEGWPVPASWCPSDPAEFSRWSDEYFYPCILKPQAKGETFRRRTPQKAFIARSRGELLRAYEIVAQWEPAVIIQEFVPGGDENVAFCLTYTCDNSEPSALFCGRKLMQYPVGSGNTAASQPAPRDWAETIEGVTRAMWKRVGYRGLGSVEFKIRPADGQALLMEPTVGRTDYQSEVAVLNGVNIPAAAYFDALGIYPGEEPSRRQRTTVLIDGPAYFISLAQVNASYARAALEWMRTSVGPHRFMVFRASDPGPFLASGLLKLEGIAGSWIDALFGRRVKNTLKRLLGRTGARQLDESASSSRTSGHSSPPQP